MITVLDALFALGVFIAWFLVALGLGMLVCFMWFGVHDRVDRRRARRARRARSHKAHPGPLAAEVYIAAAQQPHESHLMLIPSDFVRAQRKRARARAQ